MSRFTDLLDNLNSNKSNNKSYATRQDSIAKIIGLFTGAEAKKEDIMSNIINNLVDDNGKGILKNETAQGIANARIDSLSNDLQNKFGISSIEALSSISYLASNSKERIKYNDISNDNNINLLSENIRMLKAAKTMGIEANDQELIDAVSKIAGSSDNVLSLSKELNNNKYNFNDNDKKSILGVMNEQVNRLEGAGLSKDMAFKTSLFATSKVQDAIASGTIKNKEAAKVAQDKLIANYATEFEKLTANKDRSANMMLLEDNKSFKPEDLIKMSDKELGQEARKYVGDNYENKLKALKKPDGINLYEGLPDAIKRNDYENISSKINSDKYILEAASIKAPKIEPNAMMQEPAKELKGSAGDMRALQIGSNGYFNPGKNDVIVNINFNDEVVSTIGKWIARNKGE